MRPVLTPSARRLWRDRGTLQLGRAPGRAVLLAGLDETARRALALLDGTRDAEQLRSGAQAAGCDPARVDLLVGLLDRAGLLEDADADRSHAAGLDLVERDRLAADVRSLALVHGDGGLGAARARAGARVSVLGAGRVGAAVAGLLAAAGVGAVDVTDAGSVRPEDIGVGGHRRHDLGRERGQAAREGLLSTAPGTDVGGTGRPDVVVLAPTAPADLDDAAALVADGLPHLVAEVRGPTGVVGPLVVPGRSACLRCLDLTRTDLDPAWPVLAAQLALPDRRLQPCDGTLAVMVAAQAALQVLAVVDGAGTPASVGGTLELTLPDWRWRRRSWPLHPGCGCGWRDAA